ncbi:hypothetical protein I4902_13475 [Proteus alimentorum]|uniref:Tetratricopeptide repeat protein n=1 Tax=Proteus alimentorum TaxID=1973495 RepID=A0ABS0IW67_9GAMM|nr:hypothetical protein [Proteus alimentorum]MBG2876092.1 hypothetical protein [Proteus alimentorum]MBG2880271.1 hypothetical protein [Proteus alimentorum]
MITSRDVFSTRKEGKLDEAYIMAIELINKPNNDEWDIKAFAWCVIDLIKRDAQSGKSENIHHYANQLRNLNIDASDKILTDQREYALRLCNPNGQMILKAKSLSKQGDHYGALNLYKRIYNNGDKSIDVQICLAWELYRVAKSMTEQMPVNFNGAKRFINDYLKLNTEKPSLLHTCILQLADKIAKEGRLNMGAFVRIWGLENLRPEDYDPYISDDGNSYPSLAERIIQHASKDSFTNDAYEELIYLLPYLNDCINRYPDNVWLKMSKAKALMATKQSNEAFSYGLEVVKNKLNDYWAWELLGDIYQANSLDLATSCYCKALLCSKDINFVGKVKIKLAELLLKRGLTSEAKLEVDQLFNYRSENNQKIPESVQILMHSTWYQGAISSRSNHQLYLDKAIHAEELLCSDLPWMNAVLGDKFFIKGKKDKAKRKLYVQSSPLPLEVSVLESRLIFDDGKLGAALKIKGEFDRENRFQVYAIEHRSSNEDWDIFEEQIGIVDHVNTDKKIIHFMISRTIDGVIHFSDLPERFKEGDAISLRLAKYTSRQGIRYRVLTSSKTTKPIPSSILKPFSDDIREENGMGFTNDGIFIPPSLIRENSISDGDFVTGYAVLNYNKKRFEWSWKAISILEVKNNSDAD